MKKDSVTITIDNDILGIFKEMKQLNINRSGIMCDLLRFLKDNDYRIPSATEPDKKYYDEDGEEIDSSHQDHPDFVEPAFD